MPIISLITKIEAPIEVCFDLARSVDLHVRSMADTGERAIAGCQSGLMGLGDVVTWEATHFFIRQHLTSRITAFEPPHYFRDSQVQGIFHRFDHDHFFTEDQEATTMRDMFDYQSPLGVLGQLADVLLIESYMRRLLVRRAEAIKTFAESEGDRLNL